VFLTPQNPHPDTKPPEEIIVFNDLPKIATVADDREVKLPKWAQDAMRGAASDQYNRAEAATLESRKGSRVYLDPNGHAVGLGTDPIRFVLAEDGDVDTDWDYVDVRVVESAYHGRYVEIMAGRDVVIRPQVTNVVRVTVDGR
jgi:hypothetical protein